MLIGSPDANGLKFVVWRRIGLQNTNGGKCNGRRSFIPGTPAEDVGGEAQRRLTRAPRDGRGTDETTRCLTVCDTCISPSALYHGSTLPWGIRMGKPSGGNTMAYIRSICHHSPPRAVSRAGGGPVGPLLQVGSRGSTMRRATQRPRRSNGQHYNNPRCCCAASHPLFGTS